MIGGSRRTLASTVLLLIAFVCLAGGQGQQATSSLAPTNVTNATNTTTVNTTLPPCVAATKKPAAPPAKPKLDWKGITTIVLLVIMILLMMFQIMTPLSALFSFTLLFCVIGILPVADVFAGMASKGTLSLAMMFIIVHPLNHLPIVKRAVTMLMRAAPGTTSGMWPRTKVVFLSWLTSPIIENAPQVALMTPIVMSACAKMGISPREMLLPLCYAVALSNWLPFASASNLVLMGLIEHAGVEMSFFEFAKTNSWVSFLTLIPLILIPRWMFANNSPQSGPSEPVTTATTAPAAVAPSRPRGSRTMYTVALKVTPLTICSGRGDAQSTTWESLLSVLPQKVAEAITIVEVHQKSGHVISDVSLRQVLESGDEIVCSAEVPHLRSLRVVNNLDWIGVEPNDDSLERCYERMQGSTEDEPEIRRLRDDGRIVEADSVSPSSPSATDHEMVSTSKGSTTAGRPQSVPTLEPGTSSLPLLIDGQPAVFASVVISQSCPAVETVVASKKFVARYNASIVALRTVSGHNLFGQELVHHTIKAGDTVLLRADSTWAQRWIHSLDFYTITVEGKPVDDVASSHAYLEVPSWVPFGVSLSSRKKKVVKIPEWHPNVSLLILAGVIGFAVADYPLHIVTGVGVICVILLKVATVQEALEFVNWRVYVAASMAAGCGRAVVTSGLADVIADGLVQANVQGFWMLLLFHVVTAGMANVVGSVGTVNIMFPVILSYTRTAGVSIMPFVVIIAHAAMSGLMTPYGAPVTLVIAGTGQYVPWDFVKFGIPISIYFAILSAVATSAVYGIW